MTEVEVTALQAFRIVVGVGLRHVAHGFWLALWLSVGVYTLVKFAHNEIPQVPELRFSFVAVETSIILAIRSTLVYLKNRGR